MNAGANPLPNLPVHMIRQDMKGYPAFALPAGYGFRLYRPGDEAIWTRLQRAAEPFFPIEDSLFQEQFGDFLQALPDRMAFVETAQGEAVATITAWWKPNWRNSGDWGQIHWVAVAPHHQRKGLSKAMMTWVMDRLARTHTRAMLGTSTGRVWAIHVYLTFGFTPLLDELSEPEVRNAWIQLQRRLGHSILARTLHQLDERDK
jgi:GNAT superfamily N-acetyltransferase